LDWLADDDGNEGGIINNGGIRIRSSGVDYNDSWKDQFPAGIGKVILEQVKVYGYRE